MIDPKLHASRIRELIIELTNFANIERQIYLPDSKNEFRRENDAEHSYSLAIASWYLSQFIPELDQNKIIKFALAHDLVEIHAGDEMAIGRTEDQEKSKKLREKQALEILKKDWPDFEDITNAIEEYEKKESREALFVYALDKILPMQLNLITQGKTWKSMDISRTDVVNNKDEKTKKSPEIYSIWKELRREVLAHDDYFNSSKV